MNLPAMENGIPVRKNMLSYNRPSIGKEEIEEVTESLVSGWITTGPKVREFENEVCDYLGCRKAVAVNSCTSALHMALAVENISRGDEVITSPFTFVSTVNVIEYQGAKPVLADINEDTFNLDPVNLEEKINKNTKAIIPVHYGGQSCEMDEIMEISEKYDLKVIEDAAHAFGAEYRGKKVGTVGDYTCFSFYATKNLTTSEGGMITTDHHDKIDELRKLSLHGMSRDAWKRYKTAGSWYYDITSLGFKYNMTDLQASMGLHQLKKFEDMQERRYDIVERYNKSFKKIDEIKIPYVKENMKHAWHIYSMQIKNEFLKIDRDEFIEALKSENIRTSVHFIPIHMHSYYKKKYGYDPEDFPISKKVYEGDISLPLYPMMTDLDVDDVINGVKKLIEYYRR